MNYKYSKFSFLLILMVFNLISVSCSGINKGNSNKRNPPKSPNIILMMCDDLGWGDTGFNGNKIIRTPNLDKMALEGAKLNHFYSIGPVCSPTRASFLTGRHYFRMGVWSANVGHLPNEEFTIARMMKTRGYTTGHFGKWHLGTLSKTISAKGIKRKPKINFAPPWERDYDNSFVTESAVQTWNPAQGGRSRNNPYYENGLIATKNLEGDDSRVLMDRVIPFIQNASKKQEPFVAVIWFHAPHEAVIAGPEYLKMYKGYGEAAHYYGCITAVDDQVGRLRNELQNLGIADNTALFFCSDNGPEGRKEMDPKKPIRKAGVTGGFRGRKRSVNDGGVRVPALAFWPNHIKPNTVINVPMSVLDYLPTISKMTGAKMPQNIPFDGQDVMPILTKKENKHNKSIPFRYGKYACLVKGTYKMIINSLTNKKDDKLYDLSKDKTESDNIINNHSDLAQEMRNEIIRFLENAKKSHSGVDYLNKSFKANDKWPMLGRNLGKTKKN